jgi:endonuclease-3
MDELLKLSGVGRKTANLMLGVIFGKPAIIADTHCIRLSNRLGLCDTKDPHKVELTLKSIIPPDNQVAFCHGLVAHGRAVCFAKKPNCGVCELVEWCAVYNGVS